MSARKRGLTAEQHEKFGRDLHRIRLELMDLMAMGRPGYPKSDQALGKLATAVNRIDSARCGLEQRYAREHRDVYTSKTYFPGGGFDVPESWENQ